jgi:hypothetical protein
MISSLYFVRQFAALTSEAVTLLQGNATLLWKQKDYTFSFKNVKTKVISLNTMFLTNNVWYQ